MTIHCDSVYDPTVEGHYNVRRLAWRIWQWLVTHGWTVAGAANGTTGGMGGFATIPTETQFKTATAATTWVVLQSPHATPADRIQILLAANGASSTILYAVNYALDWASTTTAQPTSSSGKVASVSGNPTLGNPLMEQRWNLVYDDSTHECAIIGTPAFYPEISRNAFAISNFASFPPEPATPQAKCAVYFQVNTAATINVVDDAFSPDSGFWDTINGSSFMAAWLTLRPDGTPCTANTVPLRGRDGTGAVTELAYDTAKSVTTKSYTRYPITLFSRTNPPHYLGTLSDFMCWNGQKGRSLETYGTSDNVLTRICMGRAVNVRWNGTTQPLAGPTE